MSYVDAWQFITVGVFLHLFLGPAKTTGSAAGAVGSGLD